jgi:hypothetical protein
MTEQVRRGYRSHRRATWGVVLGLVALAAAVVIPMASGAPTKYYTLDASPASTCTSPTRQTFTLTLRNETRNQNLGSANIKAPSYAQLVGTKDGGVATLTGTTGTITVNEPDSFSSTPNTIRLRNLVLPTSGKTATITVEADVSAGSGQAWTSIAKQANDFSDSGPGNLFALKPGAVDPPLTVDECAAEYVFVNGPDDAEKGAAQTVEVQLQAGGIPVAVSGPLTLSALQDESVISNPDPSVFTGLTASAPDSGGAFPGKQWTFSVAGLVNGTGYALQAGDTVSDPTFRIAEGLCQPNTTDPEHLNSSCSLTSDLNGGILESGVTINNHQLAPIAIDFEAGSAAKCHPWIRASYTVGNQEYFFPGVVLDFEWGGGMLQVIYRVRNSDWVLTEASRGNADIEICAGAKHGIYTNLNKDVTEGGDPFTGKYGDAKWDGDLFWGVLSTVQNPAKVKSDPAVCARGTTDLATGPGGTPEKWRTWTICIPSDWDWKNFG